MAQAKQTGGRTVALNVAREGGGALEINVTGPQLDIHRVDATFRLRFGNGELLTIAGPKTFDTRDCSDIGQVFIENDEGADGDVVELFWSASVKAGKADAAAAAPAAGRRIVRELSGGMTNVFIDTFAGPTASGTFHVSGVVAQTLAAMPASGHKGMCIQNGMINLMHNVPIWNLFCPDVVTDLALLEGMQWGFSSDIEVKRVDGGAASLDVLVGFGNSQAGSTDQALGRKMFGLMLKKGQANWHFGVQIAKDGIGGVTAVTGPYVLHSEDTGYVGTDTLYFVELICGVRGGVQYLEAYLDGELIAEHTGPWSQAAWDIIIGIDPTTSPANKMDWAPMMVSQMSDTGGTNQLKLYCNFFNPLTVWTSRE